VNRTYNRGDILLVLVALPMLVVAAYFALAGTTNNSEVGEHHTSYSARESGYKAIYLLLQQRGISVRRYQASVQRWPDDAHIMISATPISSGLTGQIWGDEEVKDAIRWIEAGGTLILLSRMDDALAKKLLLRPADIGPKAALLSPRQPITFLDDVKKVSFPDRYRFERMPDNAIILFSDKNPAFLVLQRGKGLIFTAPTSKIIENKHLIEAENARFFVRLIESQLYKTNGKSGSVYFDELHQGFQSERSFWDVIGKPGQFALLQLGLLFVLIFYTAGKRFGVARPSVGPSRVSLEYVTSIASLYRRAGARDTALEGIYLSFSRDLCRTLGIPLDASNEEVARSAAAILGDPHDPNRQRIFSLLERSEEAIASGSKLSDQDLLRLTQEMDGVRKELELRGND